jgi:hypothetical protein
MRARDTMTPEIERDLDAMDAAVSGRRPDGGDPLLAELAALVAETRPAPDPTWTAELAERAAQGFARERGPAAKSRRLRLVLAPAAGLAACAVIAIAVAVGTTHGDGPSLPASNPSAGSETMKAAPAPSLPNADSSGGAAASGSAGRAPAPTSSAGPDSISPIPPPSPGGSPRSDGRSARKVQRSAEMTLGARRRDIDTVADGVANVATALGGFVASSSVASREGGDLALRVPSNRLDDAIVRLSRLAHVRQLTRNSLDITAESVSAKARVAELKAVRRSLLAQLAKATTLTEMDQIRARLHAVYHKLQAAKAASQRVENRAAYANLGVTIVPERAQAAAAGGGWSPRNALHDALRVLEVTAGIALVALAVAVPLALVGAPAWLAGRRLTRRRRERALDFA